MKLSFSGFWICVHIPLENKSRDHGIRSKIPTAVNRQLVSSFSLMFKYAASTHPQERVSSRETPKCISSSVTNIFIAHSTKSNHNPKSNIFSRSAPLRWDLCVVAWCDGVPGVMECLVDGWSLMGFQTSDRRQVC